MQTYMHDVLEELPKKRIKFRQALILFFCAVLVAVQVVTLLLVLSKPANADGQGQSHKYVAWLMVMWPDGDVKKPYVPINAYKDYQVCIDTVPKMALALKIPEGVKVDCIDKHYRMIRVEQ